MLASCVRTHYLCTVKRQQAQQCASSNFRITNRNKHAGVIRKLKSKERITMMVAFGIFLVVTAMLAEALLVSKKLDLGK